MRQTDFACTGHLDFTGANAYPTITTNRGALPWIWPSDKKASRTLTLTPAHVKTFAELKIAVKRQEGEIVLEGEAWYYTFR